MNFRLLHDGAARGAWNMAVDEAILTANGNVDNAQPTLRFYAWEPFCLSLGRLQKEIPPAALEDGRDFDVVRRPTGGRSVWHAHEITYSISAPIEWLPENARSVNGAYQWLSEGFLMGLQGLGLNAELAPASTKTNGANCFAAATSCDFLADGKKLVGAAQCRAEGAFLQHGSILLSIDRDEWLHNAGGAMDSATALREIGLEVPVEEIIIALESGFSQKTGSILQHGELSTHELDLAHWLEREKYQSASWTWEAAFSAQKLDSLLLESAKRD